MEQHLRCQVPGIQNEPKETLLRPWRSVTGESARRMHLYFIVFSRFPQKMHLNCIVKDHDLESHRVEMLNPMIKHMKNKPTIPAYREQGHSHVYFRVQPRTICGSHAWRITGEKKSQIITVWEERIIRQQEIPQGGGVSMKDFHYSSRTVCDHFMQVINVFFRLYFIFCELDSSASYERWVQPGRLGRNDAAGPIWWRAQPTDSGPPCAALEKRRPSDTREVLARDASILFQQYDDGQAVVLEGDP